MYSILGLYIALASESINNIENIDTIPESLPTSIIVIFIINYLLFCSLSNSAVRKQLRNEDNWNTSYLSFWWRLILFPRFLFSQERFKDRTIRFRKLNLISFIVLFSICLLPINDPIILIIRTSTPLVYSFWFLFLAGIFDQTYRGL